MIFNYTEIISIILLSYILFLFLNKLKIFNHLKKDKHQLFADENFVIPIGGYYIILSILILNFHFIKFEFLYIFLIFLIGVLSDLKKFNSPKYRLLTQAVLILFFVYQFEIQILSTRLDFLDTLLNNYFFNIFFVSFCILIVINGTNFIDGLNGLVLLYFSSILLILIISDLNIYFFNNEFFLIQLIIIFFFILILNLLNKIYLGDSGSYVIGFVFGFQLIQVYLNNQYISPFFIVLLLWYPCFENLFSILRKNRFKKSPINPDTKHLHQLLFYFLNKKFNFKKKIISNGLTSFVINIYNFLIFLIGLNFITKTNIQIILILVNLIIYLILYYQLFKFRFKR
tara:strand:+ start:3470 stop:4495 length:1026 start_codon:yes stop_codon:yes gene_type:complete